MKTGFLGLFVLTALLGLATQIGWGKQGKEASKEEDALLKRAEAFAEAFNKGDAKAVSAFYTENADMVDPEGNQMKGRKAITEAYAKLFARSKGAKLFIKITSVRVVNKALALEDGLTEVVLPDGPPSAAHYSIVYVKQDGEWYIESVREAIAVPPSNSKHLQDIAFLIGHWVEDVEKGGTSKASYAWAEQGNFIVNSFELSMKDTPVGGGTQWIGWDASVKKPRAWAFIFNGGFAEAVWTKEKAGEKWSIAINATMRDGKKMTAKNVFEKIDDDHFSIQFVDRTLDGKPLPDEKKVTMKRVK